MSDKNNEILKRQLESLRQAFLGIKALYKCTIPDEVFDATPLFRFFNTEALKTVLGRLYIILTDRQDKHKRHNTISFKILILKLLEVNQFKNNRKLKILLKEINYVQKIYNDFRNKIYAHIELDEFYRLRRIDDLHISGQDIEALVALIEDSYTTIYKLLHFDASHSLLESELNEMSDKIWQAYEDAGLVKEMKRS